MKIKRTRKFDGTRYTLRGFALGSRSFASQAGKKRFPGKRIRVVTSAKIVGRSAFRVYVGPALKRPRQSTASVSQRALNRARPR